MDIEESKNKHQQNESLTDFWDGAFDEKYEDTKRHFEMLKTALPIVNSLQVKTILTIGDSRGRDAGFFKIKAGCHVTATDLDISKLIPAKLNGFIDECRIEDVENIKNADNSIDLVVAKETFHHWPRPMLGFYECLRVSKYGVILIEPNDCILSEPTKGYLSLNEYSDEYEEVGNYKYCISLREILKAAWSLYLDRVFVCGFNDPYEIPFEFDKWLVAKNKLDQLGYLNQRPFNLLTVFVEKISGSLNLSDEVNELYKIYQRPKNKFMDL